MPTPSWAPAGDLLHITAGVLQGDKIAASAADVFGGLGSFKTWHLALIGGRNIMKRVMKENLRNNTRYTDPR